MEAAKRTRLQQFELDHLPSPVPLYELKVLDGLEAGALPMFTDDGFHGRP